MIFHLTHEWLPVAQLVLRCALSHAWAPTADPLQILLVYRFTYVNDLDLSRLAIQVDSCNLLAFSLLALLGSLAVGQNISQGEWTFGRLLNGLAMLLLLLIAVLSEKALGDFLFYHFALVFLACLVLHAQILLLGIWLTFKGLRALVDLPCLLLFELLKLRLVTWCIRLGLSLVGAGALVLTESVLWLEALRVVTNLAKLVWPMVSFDVVNGVRLCCNVLGHIVVFKVVGLLKLIVIVLVCHCLRVLIDSPNLIIDRSKLLRLSSFLEGILSGTPLLLKAQIASEHLWNFHRRFLLSELFDHVSLAVVLPKFLAIWLLWVAGQILSHRLCLSWLLIFSVLIGVLLLRRTFKPGFYVDLRRGLFGRPLHLNVCRRSLLWWFESGRPDLGVKFGFPLRWQLHLLLHVPWRSSHLIRQHLHLIWSSRASWSYAELVSAFHVVNLI
jgi:hypothetical protein